MNPREMWDYQQKLSKMTPAKLRKEQIKLAIKKQRLEAEIERLERKITQLKFLEDKKKWELIGKSVRK